MPLLRFQLACPAACDRRAPLHGRLCPRDRPRGRDDAGPCRVQHLSGRRHTLADETRDGRGRARRGGGRLADRPQCRGDAGGEPHQRGGGTLSRLSGGGREPRLARRAGDERCRSAPSRPAAQRRRGDGRRRHRGQHLRALLLRSDLCASRPDAGCLAGGAEGRDRPGCRPTRSPTTPVPAPSRATISFIGATANMPGSAPARMAAS